MKFFELASCLAPAVPGGYSGALFMRELILMFTNVTIDVLARICSELHWDSKDILETTDE